VATVSWFGPQNQADFGLSVVTQNRREEVNVGHTLRYNALLHLEASRSRVFQFTLKLAETRRQVVHMTPSRRSRGVKAEDSWINEMGYIGLFYTKITVFNIFGLNDVLVFYLSL
jgi:hypothetical protein